MFDSISAVNDALVSSKDDKQSSLTAKASLERIARVETASSDDKMLAMLTVGQELDRTSEQILELIWQKSIEVVVLEE